MCNTPETIWLTGATPAELTSAVVAWAKENAISVSDPVHYKNHSTGLLDSFPIIVYPYKIEFPGAFFLHVKTRMSVNGPVYYRIKKERLQQVLVRVRTYFNNL